MDQALSPGLQGREALTGSTHDFSRLAQRARARATSDASASISVRNSGSAASARYSARS